jgi:hypothetical protein
MEAPTHMSWAEFPEKVGAFLDRCLALPVVQKYVVKHTTMKGSPMPTVTGGKKEHT